MDEYIHGCMEEKALAIAIPKTLWKAITLEAMDRDVTLGEVVVPVLEKAFGGPEKRVVVDAVVPKPVSEQTKAILEEVKIVPVVKECAHELGFRNGKRVCLLCGEKV